MRTLDSRRSRDAALRRLARCNRWLLAGAVTLTGVLSEVAAQAFPGKTRANVSAKGGASGKAHKSSPAKALTAPAQAPKVPASTSTQTSEETGATKTEQAPTSTQAAPTTTEQSTTPAETARTTEAQTQTTESSSASESSSAPVVSGGS